MAKKHIFNFEDAIVYRRITPELVEELLLKRHQLFVEAEAVVRLEPAKEVEEIIAWGIFNDEPMAVYLGEKLAMVTNQIIPHELALAVGQYLSHRGPVPRERIFRCKEALKIVGKINREHIYALNQDYQHITIRKGLKRYI
jgi:hypothetical protein